MKQYQNIKNSIFSKASMDKQIPKSRTVILLALRSLGIGGIFAFLFLNFSFSQSISPIYFKFINNDETATINFLQKINGSPEYKRILEMNNNIYGSTIKKQIFAKNNLKKEVINNLEQKLMINPKSRDILYGLYQLYLEEGDKNRANDYLKQAKEVDPGI